MTGIPWQVAPKIARFLENVNDDLMVVRGMTSYKQVNEALGVAINAVAEKAK